MRRKGKSVVAPSHIPREGGRRFVQRPPADHAWRWRHAGARRRRRARVGNTGVHGLGDAIIAGAAIRIGDVAGSVRQTARKQRARIRYAARSQRSRRVASARAVLWFRDIARPVVPTTRSGIAHVRIASDAVSEVSTSQGETCFLGQRLAAVGDTASPGGVRSARGARLDSLGVESEASVACDGIQLDRDAVVSENAALISMRCGTELGRRRRRIGIAREPVERDEIVGLSCEPRQRDPRARGGPTAGGQFHVRAASRVDQADARGIIGDPEGGPRQSRARRKRSHHEEQVGLRTADRGRRSSASREVRIAAVVGVCAVNDGRVGMYDQRPAGVGTCRGRGRHHKRGERSQEHQGQRKRAPCVPARRSRLLAR